MKRKKKKIGENRRKNKHSKERGSTYKIRQIIRLNTASRRSQFRGLLQYGQSKTYKMEHRECVNYQDYKLVSTG